MEIKATVAWILLRGKILEVKYYMSKYPGKKHCLCLINNLNSNDI